MVNPRDIAGNAEEEEQGDRKKSVGGRTVEKDLKNRELNLKTAPKVAVAVR